MRFYVIFFKLKRASDVEGAPVRLQVISSWEVLLHTVGNRPQMSKYSDMVSVLFHFTQVDVFFPV